ncbi:hypothetical protein DL96DRAFT_1820691 [Flagelloscypha sp. PMI_526]|nr:hypothetical protein DL96DRAFT_1820691 [Flagelloscypha sp. PMI_526]
MRAGIPSLVPIDHIRSSFSMFCILFAALLAFSHVQGAPLSVERRQATLSKSYRDLPKPILSPYYAYFGNTQTRSLSQAFDELKMRAATIAFASAPQGKCELVADLEPLEKSNNIKDFIAKGGAVALSFGGNLSDKSSVARQHIQQACQDEASLVKLIRDSMDRFQTHNIDFDIEDNDVLADNAAAQRLANALATIKKDVPDVFITYTLGALPNGMGGDQARQVQAAKAANLDLDGILLMTMNFATGDNVKTSETSIAGGAQQVADIYGISLDAATRKMGMIPAIGADDGGVVIDLTGARDLAAFANQNNLVIQSYWNFNRDFPGGTPGQRQVLDMSSSPDQKEPSEFFKVMQAILLKETGTEPNGVVPAEVKDLVPSAADVKATANLEPKPKGSLPAVDAASSVNDNGITSDVVPIK